MRNYKIKRIMKSVPHKNFKRPAVRLILTFQNIPVKLQKTVIEELALLEELISGYLEYVKYDAEAEAEKGEFNINRIFHGTDMKDVYDPAIRFSIVLDVVPEDSREKMEEDIYAFIDKLNTVAIAATTATAD